MRIPLDYYRILGLPIQATAEQLKQAHRDRTLQLPRREYSEMAIEARKSLIDEAYSLLADAEKRQQYDTQFLTRSQSLEVTSRSAKASTDVGEETLRAIAANAPEPSLESYAPTIAIDESQFVGALLILLELGEYELVIRLGRPFLTSGSANLGDGHFGDPKLVLADIVLTLALSCLELGREQWQQSQYENAAESLETGHELLLRENVFAGIRAELQSDLYKLRPYRILELVARPLEQAAERRQGIQLLKAMLHDRGGIDGAGDDLSGLTVDDFLRFIQQLRGYLAAGEQQEIFEAEAGRPSAVATYLAVYALLARGFAFHQPALVRRAKQLLGRLSSQQDVHLEQAVCALLLGQAEEAGRALELSQEYEPLAFIREHSQNSPDLLPGLCLYAERWLREEVFTHFRDLSNQQTALKDYFANHAVQAYLEAMPLSTAVEAPPQEVAFASYESLGRPSRGAPPPAPAPEQIWPSPPTASTVTYGTSTMPTTDGRLDGAAEPQDGGSMSIAEKVSQLSPEGQLRPSGTPSPPLDAALADMPLADALADGEQNGHKPTSETVVGASEPGRRSRSTQSPRWGRLAVVFLLGILTMGTLGLFTWRALGWFGGLFTRPRLQRPMLDIGLSTPPIAIPAPPEPEAQISVEDIAERAIAGWLQAKREAMGEGHNVAALDSVLVGSLLTRWRSRAQEVERQNEHFVYTHSLNIVDVEPDDPGADALTVEAQVQEEAEYYALGTLDPTRFRQGDYTIRYDLVQQNGQWYVQDIGEP